MPEVFSTMHISTLIISVCALIVAANAGQHKTPYFDDSNQEVSVLLGGIANLTCGVKDLGDYSVVWIRTRDLHILTAGRLLTTTNPRFRIPDPKDVKILQIKSVQKEDETEYECKISTDPPITKRYKLKVLSPTTRIITPPINQHNATHVSVPRGSRLNLTCEMLMSDSLDEMISPNKTVWIQTTEEYDPEIKRVAEVKRERWNETTFLQMGSPVLSAEIFQMVLILENVRDDDEGEYSCQPEGLPEAKIYVDVVEPGKTPVPSNEASTSSPKPDAGGDGGVLHNIWSDTWNRIANTQEEILKYVKQIANHLTGLD